MQNAKTPAKTTYVTVNSLCHNPSHNSFLDLVAPNFGLLVLQFLHLILRENGF